MKNLKSLSLCLLFIAGSFLGHNAEAAYKKQFTCNGKTSDGQCVSVVAFVNEGNYHAVLRVKTAQRSFELNTMASIANSDDGDEAVLALPAGFNILGNAGDEFAIIDDTYGHISAHLVDGFMITLELECKLKYL